MKTLILLAAIGTSIHCSAKKDYFQQLCDFNPNWKNYEASITDVEYQEFHSDREYIQSHLKSVLKILRSNPTNQLTPSQLSSREHLINVLDHYRLSGIFPINDYKKRRTPVFIDKNNTHCAVGFLLRETGFESIAKRIASVDNYVWIKDIHDPELLAWQEHIGFTLDELKLIQGAYDFYLEDALTLPNRVEIPQKPGVMQLFFDQSDFSSFNVWCKGEGRNGVLNGKWIQNYAYAQPWITGYYENGDRTGKWQEFYQGTTQLCRTEHWKDDALNGLRTRFDRQGNIIEKIYFEDGKAVTKINYEMGYNPKTYVRSPIDSATVETKIYNQSGKCIAKGKEQIHNPGNLQWFQNIELTALNTFSISAEALHTVNTGQSNLNNMGSVSEFHSPKSFQSPSLVEYKKIGNWTYYRENMTDLSRFIESLVEENTADIRAQFPFFMETNWSVSNLFPFAKETDSYDSLLIIYVNDKIQDLEMIGSFKHERYKLAHRNSLVQDFDHPRYIRHSHYRHPQFQSHVTLAAIGKVDNKGNKAGEWTYFNQDGFSSKKYEFTLPEEMMLISEVK